MLEETQETAWVLVCLKSQFNYHLTVYMKLN